MKVRFNIYVWGLGENGDFLNTLVIFQPYLTHAQMIMQNGLKSLLVVFTLLHFLPRKAKCSRGVVIGMVNLDTVSRRRDTLKQKWKALMAYSLSRSHVINGIPLSLQIRGIHTHMVRELEDSLPCSTCNRNLKYFETIQQGLSWKRTVRTWT